MKNNNIMASTNKQRPALNNQELIARANLQSRDLAN